MRSMMFAFPREKNHIALARLTPCRRARRYTRGIKRYRGHFRCTFPLDDRNQKDEEIQIVTMVASRMIKYWLDQLSTEHIKIRYARCN